MRSVGITQPDAEANAGPEEPAARHRTVAFLDGTWYTPLLLCPGVCFAQPSFRIGEPPTGAARIQGHGRQGLEESAGKAVHEHVRKLGKIDARWRGVAAPFVYRLGRQIFNLKRRVRLS